MLMQCLLQKQPEAIKKQQQGSPSSDNQKEKEEVQGNSDSKGENGVEIHDVIDNEAAVA